MGSEEGVPALFGSLYALVGLAVILFFVIVIGRRRGWIRSRRAQVVLVAVFGLLVAVLWIGPVFLYG